MINIDKDPVAIAHITLDLSTWLKDTEEVSTFEPSTNDTINVSQGSISSDKKMITATISSGDINTSFKVDYFWTTNLGRADKRSIIISTEER